MPTFSRGDVVRVPFPHSDGRTIQHRPALVVSDGPVGDGGLLLWLLMITSAENRPWPGDVAVTGSPHETGLRAPSVVRPAKIAAVETTRAERIGKVPSTVLKQVDSALFAWLGLGRG
jgi:mRNA interferase MazF